MNITLAGRNLDIRLSRAARQALEQRQTPLLAEMELLFSCLIRKQVRFGELGSTDATTVSEQLSVRFRPVMTRACHLADLSGTTPLDDFPIANPRPYVPHWLAIDYRQGQWLGEFGYST
ncbi:MAG: hypothetical protein PHR30_15885 [Gallionellaceae bacterium]|nr:hypothetical protein [Gallionellaceae bacterium]